MLWFSLSSSAHVDSKSEVYSDMDNFKIALERSSEKWGWNLLNIVKSYTILHSLIAMG